MEIITKEGQEIKKYTPSEDQKTSGKEERKWELPISLKWRDYLCAGIREYSTY